VKLVQKLCLANIQICLVKRRYSRKPFICNFDRIIFPIIKDSLPFAGEIVHCIAKLPIFYRLVMANKAALGFETKMLF